jgi:hypothetical protein
VLLYVTFREGFSGVKDYYCYNSYNNSSSSSSSRGGSSNGDGARGRVCVSVCVCVCVGEAVVVDHVFFLIK